MDYQDKWEILFSNCVFLKNIYIRSTFMKVWFITVIHLHKQIPIEKTIPKQVEVHIDVQILGCTKS